MKHLLQLYIIFAFVIINAQVPKVYDTLGQKYYLTNLSVNSVDSDFGPMFFKNDMLIFSSAQKTEDNSNAKWETTGQRFLNMYKGKIEVDGNVKEIKGLSSTANTPYHESNPIFTKDWSTVYFTRNNYYDNKRNIYKTDEGKFMKIALFIAKVNAEGEFYDIVPFPYNSAEYSTGHPALSNDGKTLYFVSDMPGGLGKTDIYKCEIKENNTFSKPENLGPNINTSGREMFPYVAADNRLYFSSDGRDGLGKLDIYRTVSDEWDFAAVTNMGEPFNSSRDDFSFIISADNNLGYFSSNRTNTGKGDDDIYHFYNDYILQLRNKHKDSLLQQKMEEMKQDVSILINVLNEKTKQNLQNAKLTLLDAVTGEKLNEAVVDASGQVKFTVEPDKEYIVKANKTLFADEEIKIKTDATNKQMIIKSLELTPETTLSAENKVIIDLRPIYFDYDSSEITYQSAAELDKVVAMLLKYPSMIIEGTSHTDSRGNDDYNQKLSERRAQSTVNYILQKNSTIDPRRVFANGYGESRLINHCKDNVKCTDAEHALNRRTEFIIVNIQDFQ